MVSTLARKMRRTPTDAERKMWAILRGRQFHTLKFRRQHPIDPYIADFACTLYRLIIEIDGGQHDGQQDATRTSFLRHQGWHVVRFWNNDVLGNPDGVAERLADVIGSLAPRTMR
jgi:primosomal protein N' (replication factor Y)